MLRGCSVTAAGIRVRIVPLSAHSVAVESSVARRGCGSGGQVLTPSHVRASLTEGRASQRSRPAVGPGRLWGRRAAPSPAPPRAGRLRSCEGPASSWVLLVSSHGFRGLQLLRRSLRFCTLTPQRGSRVLPGARAWSSGVRAQCLQARLRGPGVRVKVTTSVLHDTFRPKRWLFESFDFMEDYRCFRILLPYH